jgi:probable HAF family extracellular repeat protein
MFAKRHVCCAVFVVAAPAILVAEEIRYRVKPLGYFTGAVVDQSAAFAINDLGQLIGDSLTPTSGVDAFWWDPIEGMINIGDLGSGRGSEAFGINNSGHVTGNSHRAPGAGREACFWRRDLGMLGLGDLPGGSFYSRGEAINDLDQVTGYSQAEFGSRAFLWDAQNGMISLGTLPGGHQSWGFAINNRGQVGCVSSGGAFGEACIWEPELGMRPLGPIPGGGAAVEVVAINERGQITGLAHAPSGTQAYLWDPQEGFTLCGLMPGPEPAFSVAEGMNDDGVIVGTATNNAFATPPQREIYTPFIWDRAHGMRAIAPLIEARTLPYYADLMTAADINNHGQIAATAAGRYSNRYGEAVILTPFVVGDMNCDGAVDPFDIEGFITGLVDPAAYAARWPDCFADSAGDVNQDGEFDAFDIEPFVELLGGP